MQDESNHTDNTANADFPQAVRQAIGGLRPVERHALSKRSAILNESPPIADQGLSTSGGSWGSYLHAYRRHWFLATSLGLICGLAAAAAVWISATTTYTSSSLIRVAADSPGIVYQNDKAHSSYELYKGTQMQLLTSDFVLISALRGAGIADLPVLKHEPDPVRWLAKSLDVQAPENTEILRLSLSMADGAAAAGIVRAVVDAYVTEVVDKERIERIKRLAELDRVYSEQETELRSKRTELKKLTEQLGSGDKVALSLKEQLSLQEYAEARAEVTRVRGELQKTRYAIADNEAKAAAAKAGQARPVTLADVENAVNSDAESTRLQQSLANLDSNLTDAKATVKEDGKLAKSLMDHFAMARKSLEDQVAARRKRLSEHLQTVQTGDPVLLEAEARALEAQAARLAQQEQQAVKEAENQRRQTSLLGNSSIDVEMTRAELGELEKTFGAVADERQRTRVELNSQARITVVQPAAIPTAPDKSSRIQNSAAAGLFGFLLPVGLLVWWDVRSRRVSSLKDISHGLGIRVIGTTPHVSSAALSRGRLTSKRQRKTQFCLDHSVDGIAARLCLRRGSRNARVVLVSSATQGEGKTTLSLQLARRLAKTGARTLLVDFDLRKPALHQVFDVPRAPGVSEVLRGESELGAIVRATDIDHLSLLTAGAPFSDSLGSLSNGVTRSLFQSVREQFEFVVVDGSPILPVVDSLLASQHVDSVVLAVRRDVSKLASIQSACDQLSQFGVEEIVAVLTGSKQDVDLHYGDQELLFASAAEKPRPR